MIRNLLLKSKIFFEEIWTSETGKGRALPKEELKQTCRNRATKAVGGERQALYVSMESMKETWPMVSGEQ